jgi:stage III sporulation protein AD
MGGLCFKACLFAIICTVVAVIIKQIRPDYAFLVRASSTVGICAMALSVALPLITYLRSLYSGGLSDGYDYVENVIKALGVAVLSQICADICRDLGEGSAASGVELIGRIEILLLCVPMLEAVISTVREVLAW